MKKKLVSFVCAVMGRALLGGIRFRCRPMLRRKMRLHHSTLVFRNYLQIWALSMAQHIAGELPADIMDIPLIWSWS